MATLKLALPEGELLVDLTEPMVSVGRVDDNSIEIDDGSVSSHHAELHQLDGIFMLKDLDSTNGTFVNGQQITEVQLNSGDQIRFGSIEALYYIEEVEPSEVTEAPPETDQTELKVADKSERPEDFANASPFQKRSQKAEPLAVGVFVFAGIAVLAFAFAVFSVLQVQAPF